MAELQVHRFVGKGGELVAEADLVDALHGRGVGEAVVLLLLLVVQDVALRIRDEAVHVVVASSYDLKEETGKTTHVNTHVRQHMPVKTVVSRVLL